MSARFTIRWDDYANAYKVSIPNYEGGDVVTAEAYDELLGSIGGLLSLFNYSDLEYSSEVRRAREAIAKAEGGAQ
jgi:hypothetical protein